MAVYAQKRGGKQYSLEDWHAISKTISMQRYDDWLNKRKEEIKPHEDAKAITVAPVNIIIVGCKYDLYEKYET